MDIYKLALEREKQMEAYYRDLAKKTDHKGIKKILMMLADEESKHANIVEEMSKKIPDEEKNQLMADAKTILVDIKKHKDLIGIQSDQVELYKKVRDSEKESEELYLREAGKTSNPEMKKALLGFAEEERKHYELMDEIVQFVERPDAWVESAEFSNLDRY